MRASGIMRLLARGGLLALVVSASSCGGGDDLPVCGAGPFFTVLPVDASAIASAGPLGGLNPPSHTVPNDHAGLYLNAVGVPIVVPGDMRVKRLRRTRYLVSPFRQGESDFAIYFDLCRDIEGQLGHLTTLRADLEARVTSGRCDRYSTADEMVESCVTNVDIDLVAGEALGTVGGPTAMAFDFGTYDARHETFFVNPSRVHSGTIHAVCPYELFTPALAETLLSQVGYVSNFRTAEPRCGTMQVDVAGTAQGVWVRADAPVTQSGDESAFLTLAFDNIDPEMLQVLSIGVPELGASYFVVPIEDSGRVNLRFADILDDGTLYCYSAGSTQSHFVALAADQVLTVERVAHGFGLSPCDADPATWSLSAAAVSFIR